MFRVASLNHVPSISGFPVRLRKEAHQCHQPNLAGSVLPIVRPYSLCTVCSTVQLAGSDNDLSIIRHRQLRVETPFTIEPRSFVQSGVCTGRTDESIALPQTRQPRLSHAASSIKKGGLMSHTLEKCDGMISRPVHLFTVHSLLVSQYARAVCTMCFNVPFSHIRDRPGKQFSPFGRENTKSQLITKN